MVEPDFLIEILARVRSQVRFLAARSTGYEPGEPPAANEEDGVTCAGKRRGLPSDPGGGGDLGSDSGGKGDLGGNLGGGRARFLADGVQPCPVPPSVPVHLFPSLFTSLSKHPQPVLPR